MHADQLDTISSRDHRTIILQIICSCALLVIGAELKLIGVQTLWATQSEDDPSLDFVLWLDYRDRSFLHPFSPPHLEPPKTPYVICM